MAQASMTVKLTNAQVALYAATQISDNQSPTNVTYAAEVFLEWLDNRTESTELEE